MDFTSELSWRPTIGDPSFMGWFTVVAYGVGAVLAALAARQKANSGSEVERRESRLWLAVAGGMVFLCVNKQLDLQSLFTDIGRIFARHQGWYQQRREYQRFFVAGVILGAGIFGWWSIQRFRTFWARHTLLAGGLLFLLTFIVVRAISFHHFEDFLRFHAFGAKMNWVMELTGIFLVCLAAAREQMR